MEKNCEFCGAPIVGRSLLAKYCSENCKCKVWAFKNPDRAKKRFMRSYYKHRKKRLQTSVRYYENLRKIWGATGYQALNSQLIENAEEFVAKELERLGFYDPLLTSHFSKFFPFDILAKKNEKVCAIDVTFALRKNLRNRIDLAEYLGLDVYICHLKPDFSKYYLKNLAKGKKFSSCIQDFLRDIQ